jgi:hypothetical protein
MNSSSVLLNTAYFPPIQYFSKIVKYNKVLIEQYESYGKQSFRNRCDIYGANGKLTLSVPVIEGARKKVLTKDVKIEYITNWQKIHFKSIESAYRRSPYYEYYIDDIEPLFGKNFNYLLDFNNAILEVVSDILDITPEIKMTDDYIVNVEDVIDWREGIHPKKSKRKVDNNFKPVEYTQVFSDRGGFIPNLSILDLIFNMGPESLDYLEKTIEE